jgi:NAD(P)-dependent dehydrogenase (short-subunit alcohol dehydrogenase family)
MADSEARPGLGRLKGRHVLITGAASGIGRATAELFHREGAKLALVDLNAEGVEAVAEGLGAAAIGFDLSRTAEVEAMVERAATAIGGLDGIVNCAAFANGGPIEAMTQEILATFTAVNLVAPYLICRAALPYLRRHKGATIVNIASGQGLLPNTPNNTAYAATKGGLIAFSKSLAAELAPDIRVNAVAPGVVQTAMTAFLLEGYENPNDAPFVKQYAMQRVAQPIELANAILFLTCDESSYVTGSALAVDGGRCFH